MERPNAGGLSPSCATYASKADIGRVRIFHSPTRRGFCHAAGCHEYIDASQGATGNSSRSWAVFASASFSRRPNESHPVFDRRLGATGQADILGGRRPVEVNTGKHDLPKGLSIQAWHQAERH